MYFCTMMVVGFLTGLMGSLHCAGMCGPIALALPYRGWRVGLYHLGRILTYGLIGLLFGYAGEGLFFVGMQQYLSIAAGLVMIGVYWFPEVISGPSARWSAALTRLFGGYFQRRDAWAAFSVGVLNGLLPCGLVYTAALGAVSLAHIWQGGLFMLFFGLGTIPMMATFSLHHQLLTPARRKKMRLALPVFVTVLGVLLVMRGLNLGIPVISPRLDAQGAVCH